MQVLKSTGQQVTSLGNKTSQTGTLSAGYNHYLIHLAPNNHSLQIIRDSKIKTVK